MFKYFLTLCGVVFIVIAEPDLLTDENEASGIEVVTVLGPMMWEDDETATAKPPGDQSIKLKPTIQEELTKTNESARLPTTLKPSHYDIKLRPYINGDLSIQGSVDITIKVVETTDKVVINMVDIITKNESVSVTGLHNNVSVKVVKQSYKPKLQLYTAFLSESLIPGKYYLFHMDFQGYLNDKLVGFYRSTYKDAQGKDKLLAVTQFSPTDARRAFPCFDEPSFKATFDIHLARETNMTALSNMPLISSVPIDGESGWVWDSFNTTLPMSTYLVGFLISDFGSVVSTELTHTTYKVWARKNALEQATYARDVAPEMLTFLEDYFNISFPLPKLDMAAIPDFKFGGMENWGLITYRETNLLYDPKLSSAGTKQRLGNTLAHEIAHQWFGNLVTPVWWSDLWLKEGFASFMGYVALDKAEPSWGVMDMFLMDYLQPVLARDSLQSSHPINVEVNHPDEISEIFDFISYRKGAAIIRMMQHFLTETTFRNGLTTYLNDLKFANAEQEDLWAHLTAAAHKEGTLPSNLTVKLIMDTWTLQEGYPVLTMSRQGTTATLTQEWFKLSSKTNDTKILGWWIPVTFTHQQNPSFNDTKPQFWMSDDREPLEINGVPDLSQWIIVNTQVTGYYRVNYDTTTWQLLIRQLNADYTAIKLLNRAQLLDDAFNLAQSGRLDYPTTLNATIYLKKEIELIPWNTALRNLGLIKKMFERTAAYGIFKNYLLDLLIPLYNSIGFDDHLDDPQQTQLLRTLAIAWACKLGYSSCINSSSSLFQHWLSSSENESVFSPNVQRAVLCAGISNGGEAEWDAAWKKYLQSNVGSERADILSALGCTKEVWLLSRYLKRAFTPDSGIRKQDAATVFGSIAGNIVGRDLAWNYLQDQWPYILKYFGSGSSALGTILMSATNSFNTKLEVEEMERFQSKYGQQLGSTVRTLKQALESAKINVAWMDTNYDTIYQWLKENTS